MSRRERISDFTRPVARGSFRSSNRSNYSSPVTSVDQQMPFSSSSKKRSSLRGGNHDVVRNSPKSPPRYPKQDKSKVLRRDGLKKLPEFSPPKKRKKVKLRTVLASTAVLALIIMTPVLIFRSFSQNQGGVVMSARKIIGGQNDEPKYLISSSIMDVPAKVEVIDSLDDQNRALTDSNKIGWYKNSSKSGDKGVMIFAGYVSSPDNTGALSEINKMKPGDYIQIETGDGQILIFTVKEVKKVKPAELDQADVTKSKSEDKQGLNIISYTDKSRTSNSDLTDYRYVVFATKD